MFAKNSRYYKLNDELHLDAKGREVLCKSLRLTPSLAAETYHVVDESDRVDLIAFKYFKKSKKWWRVCDANADFFSPRQLLGKEPISVARFPLLGVEGLRQFPWAQLIDALNDIIGVQKLERYEQSRLQETQQNVGGGIVISLWSERFERAIDITYNQENTNVDDLASALLSHGFPVAAPIELRRIGTEIAIPSNSSV